MLTVYCKNRALYKYKYLLNGLKKFNDKIYVNLYSFQNKLIMNDTLKNVI